MNKNVNQEVLNNLIKISESCENSLLNEIIETFILNTPKKIEAIKQAALNNNVILLNKAAYSLKASSAYLGAERLVQLSKAIEESAAEGFIPRNMDTVISELDFYFNDAALYFTSKVAA